jgi:hypothetical protein
MRVAKTQEHRNVRGPTFIAGPESFERIGQSAAVGDADTADFFPEILPGVDDRLWIVESRAARI